MPLIRHSIRFGYLAILVAGNITGILYGLMILYCESWLAVQALVVKRTESNLTI